MIRGLHWTHVAGNHDWHYEGELGDAEAHREKWMKTHLKPLYGRHLLYFSETLYNINFVMIDDSLFEITQGQLEFFREEVGKGMPVLLFMHIPVYLQKHDIDYGCGNPNWKKSNDIYYQIERRKPWPEEGFKKTTYDFRTLVLESPVVIGIYAGHVHSKAIDFRKGRVQYVVAANYRSKDLLIHFLPSEDK